MCARLVKKIKPTKANQKRKSTLNQSASSPSEFKMTDRIEPKLEGVLASQPEPIIEQRPHIEQKKRKSLLAYIGYIVGTLVILILLLPFIINSLAWAIQDFWPKYVRYYADSIGIYKLSETEARKTIARCVKTSDYKCTKKFIELVAADVSKDPYLAGLYGASLSREGQYQDALPLLNVAAAAGKSNAFIIRELCITNSNQKIYKAALPWCASAIKAEGFKSTESYPLIRAFVDSLIAENQKIAALTAILKFDAIPHNFTRTDQFYSERAMLESSFDETARTVHVYSLTPDGYETTIRIGKGKYMTTLVRSSDVTNVMSQKDFQESGASYRSVKRESAKSSQGSQVGGQLVELDSIAFGGITYNKMPTFVCDPGNNCAMLVGNSVLKPFKVSTESLNGVPVLVLNRK